MSQSVSSAIYLLVIATGLIAFNVLRRRRRVRWAVRAKPEVIGWADLPPEARELVTRTLCDLSGLGFELAVMTRARRATLYGKAHWWYRVAVLNRAAGDGATLDWWRTAPRDDAPPAYLSAVHLRMFRYFGRTGYLAEGRLVAQAGRIDQGRWGYDPVADPTSIAAHYASLRQQVGGRPARPVPFATNAALVTAIGADSDRVMAASLAKNHRLDRTGRWLILTWRAAIRASFRPRRRGGETPGVAGRGFEVVPGPDLSE